ncbi:hypothetical protein [Chishuiella sp.]|uniref:hypothetical protein n=1 Tax=Chishuiella sp. TaxID=1969467 RepID=UPI0028A9C79A|nr:hypothetical protein [Chishuiella sp.]
MKLSSLFKYLPNKYSKEVCTRMKLELNNANKQKIWRVKNGLSGDAEILTHLIKLAKEQQKIAKKNEKLLEAE